jgi:hypothetical protein
MELTNFTNFRNDFLSDLESIDRFSLQNAPLDYGLNLQFKTLRDLFAYLVGIHNMEPIFGNVNTFIKPNALLANYTKTYEQFITESTISGVNTFSFLPITGLDESGLTFFDSGLYGERNNYKPLGAVGEAILDSKITMSLQEAIQFFDSNFKNKYFKGAVVFTSVKFYTKGEVIYISDKNFYILVTSYKDEREGVYSYSGVLTVKGS